MNRRQFVTSSSLGIAGLAMGRSSNPRLSLEGALGSIYDELKK